MSTSIPKIDGLRILSLDGGDLNCISQLRILDEFMQRLQYDTKETLRPCQYFLHITGVGASGVIAILLGVLGLSVDDASAAFLRLCKECALDEKISPLERSEKLVAAIDDLLKDLEVPEGTRLRGGLVRGEGCKVSIPYLSAVDMTNCRILRSYDARHSSYNPTISEAIQIAWANPSLFSPVRTGGGFVQEQLISAVDGFNNPTLQAIKEAYEAFGKDQRVSCLLSLGAGKPLTRSLSLEGRDLAQKTSRDTEIAADQLKRRFAGVSIYSRLSVDRSLDTASNTALEDRVGRITSYTLVYLETPDASDALDRCVRISRQSSNITMENLYRTRATGSRSSHGLPPLSAFFVPRKKPMEEIMNILKKRRPHSPAMALVTGLSGTGKTQISLKYAYDHDDEYDHILFIDASSTESIEKSLISRIRLIDRQLRPFSAEEALDLLANPDGNLTPNWLIVMDNADDTKVDLRNYIPFCEHGSVLITSRNAALSDLYPDGHIAMDVMSQEEAVDALLSAALGVSAETDGPVVGVKPAPTRSEKDSECAIEIVEELGCLPLAVIQAACYIKKNRCLHEYPTLLKTSRSKILRWPASVQRDKLKYAHSTYTAFDTTLSALSSRALKLLGVISFVHFSDFPKALIALAASSGFDYQPYYLRDRPFEYHTSISLLNEIFCPSGQWDSMELDMLLEELQTYSLVTLVPVSTVVTLRFHPLLHGWAKDRLSYSEHELFQAAAIRLLVCGTNKDDNYLWSYLSSHVELFSLSSNEIHVNDKMALTDILEFNGQSSKAFEIRQEIHAIVLSLYGERDIRTSRAALQLADSYGNQNDWDQMEIMERDIVQMRKETLGENNIETAHAIANLARTCRWRGERYEEAEELEREVLRIRRDLLGPRHRKIVDGLKDLADTLLLQKRYVDVQDLLGEALDMIVSLVGQVHVATIEIMEQQALCYTHSGDRDKAIYVMREVIGLWRTIRGDLHAQTVETMTNLAKSYSEQGQYAEAEKMWRKIADGRRETLGEWHEVTLDVLTWLAKSVFAQQRYEDAQRLWTEVAAGRREKLGDRQAHTLAAVFWIAKSAYNLSKYAEAENLLREVVAGRRETLGDEHKKTLKALDWLAHSIYNQKRYADAEMIWSEVAAVRRETLGHGHSDVLNAFWWLGRSVLDQERWAEAERLFSEVVVRRQEKLGDSHEDTLEAVYWLALATFKQERYPEAEWLWSEVSAGRREKLGEKNGETSRAMFWLAKAIQSQGRYDESQVLLAEVLANQREVLERYHEDILETLELLASALASQNLLAESELLWSELVIGSKETRGDSHERTLMALDQLAQIRQRRSELQDPPSSESDAELVEEAPPSSPSTCEDDALVVKSAVKTALLIRKPTLDDYNTDDVPGSPQAQRFWTSMFKQQSSWTLF